MPTTSSLSEAIRALDCLCWLEVRTGKANEDEFPSILTEDGFIRSVLREAEQIQKEVGQSVNSPEVRARLRTVAGIDWRGITPAMQIRALDAMANLIKGLPSEFAPGIDIILDDHGQLVSKETHAAESKKYKEFVLNPSFNIKNERAVSALADSASIFFKPEYEAQSVRFRARAQKTLASGLERGLGSRGIGALLAEEFRESGLHRHYWDTVAAVHVSRARSFSSLATYAENGITEYEVLAVRDERTTQICRMMDGQILSIESALDAFDSFEDSEDLEEIKTRVAPFMRLVGNEIQTVNGARIATRSGDGWTRVGTGNMNAKGINAPPYHFRCRTTVVPVISS